MLITPPAQLITTANAKAHLKVDTNTEDTLIEGYIRAATDYVEQQSAMRLGNQTWTHTTDHWRTRIYLPEKPVQSITSITYRDENGTNQTWNTSNYRLVKSYRGTSWVEARPDAEFPNLDVGSESITITYVAGFGNLVPALAIQAVQLALGMFHEDRTGESVDKIKAAVMRCSQLIRGY